MSAAGKEIKQQIRKRRLRNLGILLLLLFFCIQFFSMMDFEKADYSEALNKEIRVAEKRLQKISPEDRGNEKGKYAKATLENFKQDIQEAKEAAQRKDSEYQEKKKAYERLKRRLKQWKKERNKEVISSSEVKKIQREKSIQSYSVPLEKEKEVCYTVDGAKIKEPVTMNLQAKTAGPDAREVGHLFQQLDLQGTKISLYQDGTFGGEIVVSVPYPDKGNESAYVYSFCKPTGILSYRGEAKIEKGTAEFHVDQGGTYILTEKDLHSAFAKEDVPLEEVEKKYGIQERKTTEKEKIKVSLEIRCDTLRNNLSKLKNPELKKYVPEDGTILREKNIEMEQGDTVYDLLNEVCRNKEIQMESTYTSVYDSRYIKGINHLYEFDAGKLSGWNYKVNDKAANYGCSSYLLKDGDRVLWEYTCNMGKDTKSEVKGKEEGK